jgi:hypothetical protein
MFQSQKAHKLRPKAWKKFRQTPFMYDSRLENKFIRPKMKLIKEQWTIPHTHTHSPDLVLKDYHPFPVPKQNFDATDLIAGRKM